MTQVRQHRAAQTYGNTNHVVHCDVSHSITMHNLYREMEANLYFRHLEEKRKHNAGYIVLILKTIAKYGSRTASVRIIKDWCGRRYYEACVEKVVGGMYKRVYVKTRVNSIDIMDETNWERLGGDVAILVPGFTPERNLEYFPVLRELIVEVV